MGARAAAAWRPQAAQTPGSSRQREQQQEQRRGRRRGANSAPAVQPRAQTCSPMNKKSPRPRSPGCQIFHTRAEHNARRSLRPPSFSFSIFSVLFAAPHHSLAGAISRNGLLRAGRPRCQRAAAGQADAQRGDPQAPVPHRRAGRHQRRPRRAGPRGAALQRTVHAGGARRARRGVKAASAAAAKPTATDERRRRRRQWWHWQQSCRNVHGACGQLAAAAARTPQHGAAVVSACATSGQRRSRNLQALCEETGQSLMRVRPTARRAAAAALRRRRGPRGRAWSAAPPPLRAARGGCTRRTTS